MDYVQADEISLTWNHVRHKHSAPKGMFQVGIGLCSVNRLPKCREQGFCCDLWSGLCISNVKNAEPGPYMNISKEYSPSLPNISQ